MSEADKVEKEKRVYQVSLLLRRKPVSFICQFVAQNWGLDKRQAYRYIAEARKEWQKYFKNVKGAGIGYFTAQVRDLKDTAISDKDTRLVLDIAKEEAKLMGIYPSEKYKIEVEEIFVKKPKDENENSESGKSEGIN